jgi:hypothetical protein
MNCSLMCLLQTSHFPPLINLAATIYWNIVENGIKHHNSTLSIKWFRWSGFKTAMSYQPIYYTTTIYPGFIRTKCGMFGIKYWTSNPVWVTFQEHGSSFCVNIEEKVWLLVKRLTGWLKLRFLTEILNFLIFYTWAARLIKCDEIELPL